MTETRRELECRCALHEFSFRFSATSDSVIDARRCNQYLLDNNMIFLCQRRCVLQLFENIVFITIIGTMFVFSHMVQKPIYCIVACPRKLNYRRQNESPDNNCSTVVRTSNYRPIDQISPYPTDHFGRTCKLNWIYWPHHRRELIDYDLHGLSVRSFVRIVFMPLPYVRSTSSNENWHPSTWATHKYILSTMCGISADAIVQFDSPSDARISITFDDVLKYWKPSAPNRWVHSK